LARYSAWSAAWISASQVCPASAGRLATPMLSVTRPSGEPACGWFS
jgi:hypothetical protein